MEIPIEDILLSTEGSFCIPVDKANEVYQHKISSGELSTNQVRNHMGLPSLPGGDAKYKLILNPDNTFSVPCLNPTRNPYVGKQ